MRFYHFKGGDKFEFEAHIFASNDQRAAELFFIHTLMNEESDYQMIWREVDPEELDELDRGLLCVALALNLEGIAKRDSERGWWPVPPQDMRTVAK
jgi:hypothetical protein